MVISKIFSRYIILFFIIGNCFANTDTSRRAKMISDIKKNIQETQHLTGKKEFSSLVMDAMRVVPRHEFCTPEYKEHAYSDRPLSIGFGQTISQPFIVALMTEMVDPKPTHTVLEVGTGSGYQAAILSTIVKHVYSIEIIPQLADRARETLHRLNFKNVTVNKGDGYYGDKEHAPFDSIIVTAAAGHISQFLIEQLKVGGKMIIPVGEPFQVQRLIIVNKDIQGNITTKSILPVAFVPLTGKH